MCGKISIGTTRDAKERIALIIRSIIMIFVIIVVIMQLDTGSVMRDVRSAFYCPDYYVPDDFYDQKKYNDPNLNYVVYESDTLWQNIYAYYNITRVLSLHSEETRYIDQADIDLKLHRLFTWHNFRRGKLWFIYSIEVTDARRRSVKGAWDIPVKLTIEKVKGVWSVTDIEEAL
jgi:hypothetical protein